MYNYMLLPTRHHTSRTQNNETHPYILIVGLCVIPVPGVWSHTRFTYARLVGLLCEPYIP